jgi:predicted N-acyltransferase
MRTPVITTTLARTAAAVESQVWETLGTGESFIALRWLSFCEQVLPDEQPLYVAAYHAGQPVGLGIFWLTSHEPLPMPAGPARRLLKATIRRWPLLICRVPLANLPGLILTGPDEVQAAARRAIFQRVEGFARRHHVSFVLLDYLPPEQPIPPGFLRQTGLEPGTRLHLDAASWDEFVAGMRKSVYKDYRRHNNRARDLGISLRTTDTLPDVERAIPLIQHIEEKHGSEPNPYTRRLIEQAHRVEHTWLLAEIEGQMVGCGLLLGLGQTRFLALLGLDEDVKYVYFQLLYRAIEEAIRQGVRELRGGTGAYQAKERLGFEKETNTAVAVYSHRPWLRYLLRRLL